MTPAALNVEDIYGLSPRQEELFGRQGREPDAGGVCQIVHHLRPVAEDALWRAWEQVTARHLVLRTSFHGHGMTRNVQVVHRRADVRPERRDWSHLPPARRKSALTDFLAEDRNRPFDPTHAPLMRWALLRLEPESAYLVWSYHPLILDRESALVVVHEVLAVHAGLRTGAVVNLPRAGRFRDHVARVGGRETDAAEGFWRAALRGFTVPTALPRNAATAKPNPEGTAGEQRLWLPPRLVRRLAAAGQRYGVQLGVLIEAAWAVVLGWRSEDDVVFGLLAAGQRRPAAEAALAGPVGGVVPLRVRVPADEPVGTWLRGLQDRVEAALSYDFLPPDRVRACAEVPPGAPLFRTVLTVESRRAATAGPVVVANHRPDDPVALSAEFRGGGLKLRLTQATGFGAADATRALARFRVVLVRLAGAPADRPLGQVVRFRRRRRGPVLTCLRAGGTRPPLFCVHGAGGGVLPYSALARHLGPDQPLYAFDAQGVEDRHPPHVRVEDMAAFYLKALRAVQPHGPYFLAGWSAGGLVAYEMARRLAADGHAVGLLAVFDQPVPEPGQEPVSGWTVLTAVVRAFGLDLTGREDLKGESPAAVLAALVRHGAVLPAGVDEKNLRRRARVFRSHAAAAQAFAPLPYPGPMTLFRAADGGDDPHPEWDMGWGRFAAAVDVREVPGNHDTLFREPHGRELAARLRECLAAAGA